MKKFTYGNGFYLMNSEEELSQKKHIINFSGGRTSAYLCLELLKIIPREQIIINFANTGKESAETLDFVNEFDKYIGGSINWIELRINDKGEREFEKVTYETASRDGRPFREIVTKLNCLPNVSQRLCTGEMKLGAMWKFIKSLGLHKDSYVKYIGIRYDEPKRWSKVINQFPSDGEALCYPLVDWNTTREQVISFWKTMPFDLKIQDPFGNCDLCFLKSVKRRVAILKEKPETALFWIEMEKLTGMKFDINYSVTQLLKIATGKTVADLSNERDYDISCLCNID